MARTFAGQLGIAGSSRNPINYGPPNLSFTNFGNLQDAAPSERANTTISFDEGVTIVQGDHTVRIGGTFRRMQLNSISELNAARLLQLFPALRPVQPTSKDCPCRIRALTSRTICSGLPQVELYPLRQSRYLLPVVGGERIRPGMTGGSVRVCRSTLACRYEYQPPFREKYNRMANLDVAPGFADVAPVLSGGKRRLHRNVSPRR